ncbi:hypothetical protein PHYPSEUDO_000803 [Phytophthora pseudosyringae]|uniref:Uncharacterized protein n=1 Tax=Phytophthora pseudosyringae TaxID=221518 RepID=A0A8T1WGR1_9STRA|nr:hypothetical protein PHYPSEUDO_000803 [Phytophthora pseudosyringae]
MAARSRHAVLSLTTRFCLPHEGMATLDYLSSGSAVVLSASSGGPQSPSLRVVTCQHVACPWLFPKYFLATWDWLQFVNEGHVRHSLQLLAVGGEDASNSRPKVLLELPLAAQVQTHASRDLALLTLADSAALESWRRAEEELGVRTLTLQQTPCEQGDAVFFSGHRQVVSEQQQQQQEGYQTPTLVAGHFVGRSSSGQEFAWSRELLEEGMCGGAVLGATTDECVGVVEGIVPTIGQGDDEPATHEREAHAAWQMRQALAGHVAFIPASDVRRFVEEPSSLLLTGMALPPHL